MCIFKCQKSFGIWPDHKRTDFTSHKEKQKFQRNSEKKMSVWRNMNENCFSYLKCNALESTWAFKVRKTRLDYDWTFCPSRQEIPQILIRKLFFFLPFWSVLISILPPVQFTEGSSHFTVVLLIRQPNWRQHGALWVNLPSWASPYISTSSPFSDKTNLHTEALAGDVGKSNGLIVFLSLLDEEHLLTQILLHMFLRCWADHCGLNSCRMCETRWIKNRLRFYPKLRAGSESCPSTSYTFTAENTSETPETQIWSRARVYAASEGHVSDHRTSRCLTVEVRWRSELEGAVDVILHLQDLCAVLQHLWKDVLCDRCFLQDDHSLLVINLKKNKLQKKVKKGTWVENNIH